MFTASTERNATGGKEENATVGAAGNTLQKTQKRTQKTRRLENATRYETRRGTKMQLRYTTVLGGMRARGCTRMSTGATEGRVRTRRKRKRRKERLQRKKGPQETVQVYCTSVRVITVVITPSQRARSRMGPTSPTSAVRWLK